ncbi:HupE/UreJ family protein [Acuticoccus kandeliae]|uniref:HupE/UreJ family protein n=1 Tax=Acuticoccus kandeliae TaxID=2073160 RepID=UPI001474EB27|nr:HupE/UreJ family protein [Acuticoccus kandeliae]
MMVAIGARRAAATDGLHGSALPIPRPRRHGSLVLRTLLLWLILVCAALAASGRAQAHDVPADIRINGFVRPAGDQLQLLLRVPMRALLEVDFPKHGRGYLTISEAEQPLRNAVKLWLTDNIDVYEDGRLLPKPEVVRPRVSLPSNRDFTSFDTALAHLSDPPLADDLDLYWNQQMLDVLLAYPITSETSRFTIALGVEQFALRVETLLRFLPPGGGVRAFEFVGNPGLIHLDPSWAQAAWRFFVDGFHHILGGADHLLFLLCLVVPFLRLRPLLILVTSFTLAHSVSLTAAAFGFVPQALWFPPLIETLIAATIVWMGLENIVVAFQRGAGEGELRRRWIVTFCFGLIHGFGFSFLLREQFQFAGDHLVTSLAMFNLGVEAGQILVLLILVPLLRVVFATLVSERLGVTIISALVVHTAWHWMIARGDDLMQFPFPTLDPLFLAGVLRALLAILVIGVALALVDRWLARRRLLRPSPPIPDDPAGDVAS